MLKNFVKEGQKLPLYGIGPYLINSIILLDIIAIVVFGYVLKIGIMDGVYAWVRNPMYSGIWFLITGISLMWHNKTNMVNMND